MADVNEQAKVAASLKQEQQEVKADIEAKLKLMERVRKMGEEYAPKFLRERDAGGNHRLTVFIQNKSPIVSGWEGPSRLAKVDIGGGVVYCSSGDDMLEAFPKVFVMRRVLDSQVTQTKIG